MSIKKIKRKREVDALKNRKKELLEFLDLSKRKFHSLKVRVKGRGIDYKEVTTNHTGHKPSLKSQYSLLYDTWLDKLNDEKILEELKKKVDENKEVTDESEG